MIYKVNVYNNEPIYFDETTNNNAKAEAEELLLQNQINALNEQAIRFSICATFVDGNNTIWREIKESDPEDTVCQVFDTFTGTYTETKNKTEAYALNEQKRQEFLQYLGLDKVYELNEVPNNPKMPQPISNGTQTL